MDRLHAIAHAKSRAIGVALEGTASVAHPPCPLADLACATSDGLSDVRRAITLQVQRAAEAAVSAILSRTRSTTRTVANEPTPSPTTQLGARSDEELFVLHRGGDPRALRVLMQRYAGELHGFLTRLVGSRAGADDVFQEAFLQVHLSADAFDSERRFRPWLYTIAANKGRDFIRRQRRRAAVSLDAPVSAKGDAALVDLLAGNDQSPSTPMEAFDERAVIKQVIDEMPPHFREILLLSYFQRLSYAQISDSLGIPLGTVKSRLHAAVASFAQSWKLACARRGIRTPNQTPESDE
jgi:RNA polymerase sigma-70 factor (ECF subfamily)